MAFKKGPEVNPFLGASQDPIDLLESITAMELASCVPVIKIVKIDPRNGKPSSDSRPLMFDLVQTPQFGSIGEDFGVDQETFKERALVSLQSLKVDTKLSYGFITFRDITLTFTVHRPELVFDRFSKVPWREIMEEGVSFSLEYGWSADPTLVKNDLFNGNGHVTDRGQVIKSTQTVLLVVSRYTLQLKQSGEVDVTVFASENGDIALRESRFSDVADATFGLRKTLFFFTERTDDKANAQKVKALVNSITPVPSQGRGVYLQLGDVLDSVIAPMVETAARTFGYAGQTQLLLSNFNVRAGQQADQYGSRDLSALSIADFLIPKAKLVEQLSEHFSSGRAMLLQNFINIIINMVNAAEAWGPDVTGNRQKPEIVGKTDTVRTASGDLQLVFMVYDRKTITDVFNSSDRLPLEAQTKERVFQVLRDRNVPVLEFSRAGSLVLDASFEIQPDPQLQAIQVEAAYKDRRDRVQATQMPDVESRAGQVRPHEIVPASILEGSVTMYGNFVLETFGLIWVEFFRSSTVSGVFHALEKSDTVESGKFVSTVKLISEGLDPLNTRRRLTDGEINADLARGDALRKKK